MEMGRSLLVSRNQNRGAQSHPTRRRAVPMRTLPRYRSLGAGCPNLRDPRRALAVVCMAARPHMRMPSSAYPGENRNSQNHYFRSHTCKDNAAMILAQPQISPLDLRLPFARVLLPRLLDSLLNTPLSHAARQVGMVRRHRQGHHQQGPCSRNPMLRPRRLCSDRFLEIVGLHRQRDPMLN